MAQRAEIEADEDGPRREHYRVEGLVQGVGFRPYVFSLAERLQLSGFVANDLRGLRIEVEGPPSAIRAFATGLVVGAPPLAEIDSVRGRSMAPQGGARFVIRESDAIGTPQTSVSPDRGTCSACLAELFDPGDRRFRHPFINCTHCGPRFTILRTLPFDRARTSMAEFPLCAACQREFDDPASRRFHAQALCCPDCGPRLRWLPEGRVETTADAVLAAARSLLAGRVLAVKGLGGFHLAALASREEAVAALRSRKGRDEKPFALLVSDLDAARQLAGLDAGEEEALTSSSCPIVLARRRDGAPVAAGVAPGNPLLGLMLPYTPLHHLLARACGEALVMTSGNRSDEPIAHEDADALTRLADIADDFLVHDRGIHMRCDDSVVRVYGGRLQCLRRSRGHAPQPLDMPLDVKRPVLACGGELKNTFCFGRGNQAFLSHHIGDLENVEALASFTAGIAHYGKLFEIEAEVVAHDLHPDYLSTRYAMGLGGIERVAVQHHHAHVAACLVDNHHVGPVIGVAFDGLGYGDDGTLWGGEFLVADLKGYERAAHFEPVPMPGGVSAIREPWRMAIAHLVACYGDALPEDLGVVARHRANWAPVAEISRTGFRSPLTSSAGRLFDAVSALVGLRDRVAFEGQAAIELEHCADPFEKGAYPISCGPAAPWRLAGGDAIRAVVDDLRSGVGAGLISARFHNGVSQAIVSTCVRIREARGLSRVALTGGVFQNARLLASARAGLEAAGFQVLVHARVPANDGGLSLGQLAVAAARL